MIKIVYLKSDANNIARPFMRETYNDVDYEDYMNRLDKQSIGAYLGIIKTKPKGAVMKLYRYAKTPISVPP